nr:MAG TPA: hypothetical protein [Caudoviricetes sp.]
MWTSTDILGHFGRHRFCLMLFPIFDTIHPTNCIPTTYQPLYIKTCKDQAKRL